MANRMIILRNKRAEIARVAARVKRGASRVVKVIDKIETADAARAERLALVREKVAEITDWWGMMRLDENELIDLAEALGIRFHGRMITASRIWRKIRD